MPNNSLQLTAVSLSSTAATEAKRYVQQGKAMVENDTNNLNRLAADIENAVNEDCQQLRNLSDETIEARLNPGDWSVKEIVGHLVDSVSNNHQRFIRLQVADRLVFPDYSQGEAQR